MERIIDYLVLVGFTFGVGLGGAKMLSYVKKETGAKISKGLSPSEPLSNSLTGKKLPF